MAIQWGAYSQRARLGIDVSMSPATVGSGTSSVTLTWSVWMQSNYTSGGYSGTYALARTGTGPTGTTNVTFTNVLAPVKLWQGTQSVTTSHTAAVARTLTAELPATGGLFDGANPVVTRSFSVPIRPPVAPTPPTSVSAAYVSDSRIDVSWVRPANAATAGTIWTTAVVERLAVSTGVYAQVALLSGTSTSWSDTSVKANDSYHYRVRATNVTGSSTRTDAPAVVSTTPAAPSAVTAVKDAAGDIVVTWQDNSLAETGFDVEDGTTSLITSYPASPYTHVSPNTGVTHAYRVRAVAAGPRYSPWSAYSNTVQLLAAPAAPSNLAPNGAAHQAGSTLTLTWVHNPVDSTPQTAYELQHRLVGAGSWTTMSGTTLSARVVTGYVAGNNVEWRVRTKGAHADWSPYSATATFLVAAPPSVSISTPTVGAVVGAPSLTVSWMYYQPASHPQGGWEAEIRQGSTVVASQSASTAATSWVTPSILADGGSYTARVRVRSSYGLWSPWGSAAFTVDYLEPAESFVDAAWQDGYGNVTIEVAAGSGAGLPATISHQLERSLDGGNTWVMLAESLPTSTTFVDWTSPSWGTFHYRVSALSAVPSMAVTVVEVTVADSTANCVVWVSGGPGFALACPLAYNPTISHESGRERALHAFSGRSVPVEFSSRQVPTSMRVEASFLPDSYVPQPGGPRQATRGELEDLFAMPGPHLYRDPYGRVMYGTLSGLSWSREPGGMGRVSFTVTRSAPPDAAQAAALAGFYAPRIAEVAPGVYQIINADVVEAEPGVYVEITG